MTTFLADCIGPIRTADLRYEETWERIFGVVVNFSTTALAIGVALAYAAWRMFRASRRRSMRPITRFVLRCVALLLLAASAVAFALPFVTVATDPKC